MFKHNQYKKGFTLIEIMVSMSIFVVVMVVAVGAVLSAVDADRKSQSLSAVMNNLNVALESTVRDIRTGIAYDLLTCSPVGGCIKFTNSNGKEVTYSLVGTTLNKNFTNPADGISGDIVSSDVTIETFNVKKISGSSEQPIVSLQIKGYAGSGKTKSNFTIQTLVTERQLNN